MARDKIWRLDLEWARCALCDRGLTMADIAREYGCSREAIRQLVKKSRICVKRSLIWHASRLGDERLSNREWFITQIKKMGSLTTLARMWRKSRHRLQRQAQRLGIPRSITTPPSQPVGNVWKSCQSCKKLFLKRRHDIRAAQQRFFCSRACQGRWLGQTHGGGKAWYRLSKGQERFIEQHWREMSDSKIAGKLKLAIAAVTNFRRRNDLRKPKGASAS